MSRRSVPQLSDQPLLVVFLDEFGHRHSHFLDVPKYPSIDGLLLQRPIESFGDPIGFRL
jgi:hypothetical protein